MKLDFDLVRRILIDFEEQPANSHPSLSRLADVDQNTLFEHLELLDQHGLIEANIQYSGSGEHRIFNVFVVCLKWEGHEFLANAKNDTVWTRTKGIVAEKGGSAAFSVFTNLLTKIATAHFGIG